MTWHVQDKVTQKNKDWDEADETNQADDWKTVW